METWVERLQSLHHMWAVVPCVRIYAILKSEDRVTNVQQNKIERIQNHGILARIVQLGLYQLYRAPRTLEQINEVTHCEV